MKPLFITTLLMTLFGKSVHTSVIHSRQNPSFAQDRESWQELDSWAREDSARSVEQKSQRTTVPVVSALPQRPAVMAKQPADTRLLRAAHDVCWTLDPSKITRQLRA